MFLYPRRYSNNIRKKKLSRIINIFDLSGDTKLDFKNPGPKEVSTSLKEILKEKFCFAFIFCFCLLILVWVKKLQIPLEKRKELVTQHRGKSMSG